MRHFVLLLLAVSTLAVVVSARKKLEELSPNSRKYLKEREELLDSMETERQTFFRETPGGNALAEFFETKQNWEEKVKGLPEDKRGPAPKDDKVPYPAKVAYGKYCKMQIEKLEAQARKNSNAFNELYVNRFVTGNEYRTDCFQYLFIPAHL